MAGNVVHLQEKSLPRICQAIRDLFEGRSNAVGSVTLTASTASTVVTARNCGADSKVFLFPRTANAAAELGAGTAYITAANIERGQFTITHANNAQVDRTFSWVAIG